MKFDEITKIVRFAVGLKERYAIWMGKVSPVEKVKDGIEKC